MRSRTDIYHLPVLVVDDDDFQRRVMRQALHSLGFSRIEEADNGQSALNAINNEKKISVILCDIHMPILNGLEMLRQIRLGKTHGARDTRVVFLTSYANTEVLGTAMTLDVNGFVVKPAQPEIMLQKILRALSKPMQLHPTSFYEAVNTNLDDLLKTVANTTGAPAKGSARPDNNKHALKKYSVPLSQLQPGQLLAENLVLKNGILLMSAGQSLDEQVINCLQDLADMLPTEQIPVNIP